MDHCASVLMGFPSEEVLKKPDDIVVFENALKQHIIRVETLFKDQSAAIGANAMQLLQCLDPSINSLSYLALLDVLIPATAKPDEVDAPVIDKIVVFLLTFDPRQIRYIGHVFSSIFGMVASGQMVPPSIAVSVLSQALLKIEPTGSMLTSHHLSLVKLAYHTDNMQPVLPIISKNIVYYPGMANQKEPVLMSDPNLGPPFYISKISGLTSNLRPSQVLEYDLVAGLIHCSQRDWAAARAALERVVSYPCKDGGVSKIMVEAHKKWVLVGLLLSGKTAPTPPHTSANAARTFGVLGKPYLQVADSFDSLDAEALKTEAEVSWTTFVDDANEGLMRQVIAAHQQWQIASLRNVYSKISIAEVRAKTKSAETGANLVSDDEVEALITSTIQSGMIKAVIHKSSSSSSPDTPTYLEFLPPASELTEAQFAAQIAAAAARIKHLDVIFKSVTERLATSKDYVRHVLKEQKREKDGPAGASSFDNQIEDEDLMVGVLTGP